MAEERPCIADVVAVDVEDFALLAGYVHPPVCSRPCRVALRRGPWREPVFGAHHICMLRGRGAPVEEGAEEVEAPDADGYDWCRDVLASEEVAHHALVGACGEA